MHLSARQTVKESPWSDVIPGTVQSPDDLSPNQNYRGRNSGLKTRSNITARPFQDRRIQRARGNRRRPWFSLDTSGESLHKRGQRMANKAPMREHWRQADSCSYDGNEPVYDPMCGSGNVSVDR
jgi:hypothetical protein